MKDQSWRGAFLSRPAGWVLPSILIEWPNLVQFKSWSNTPRKTIPLDIFFSRSANFLHNIIYIILFLVQLMSKSYLDNFNNFTFFFSLHDFNQRCFTVIYWSSSGRNNLGGFNGSRIWFVNFKFLPTCRWVQLTLQFLLAFGFNCSVRLGRW